MNLLKKKERNKIIPRKKIKISKYENDDLFILKELFNHILLYVGNPHNCLLLSKQYYHLITNNFTFTVNNKLIDNYILYWKNVRYHKYIINYIIH